MRRPSLVLLHGVGLDRSVWEPVTALLPDRCDIVAPDLPGHGDRPPVADGVTLADLARAVAAGVRPGSHVVGFSLGALVAQHLAIHRPELVASLTCVSSVCRRTQAERAAVLNRLDLAARDFPASVEASLERWFGGTGVSAEWVSRTRATLLGNDTGSFLRCYRVFATADADLSPRLSEIAAPLLAVTGADDPGSTPEMTFRLAGAVPGGRTQIIPNSRHMLPLERPGVLATALTAFIGEHAHA